MRGSLKLKSFRPVQHKFKKIYELNCYSNSTLNVAFKSCLENQIKNYKKRIQLYAFMYKTEKCAKCLLISF